MLQHGKLPELPELLRACVGSARYGLLTDNSDRDIFILTPKTAVQIYDPDNDETYFVWSIPQARAYWGHPLLLENLTGKCTGNEYLCAFLQEHKRDIYYAAPAQFAVWALKWIAEGERYGQIPPIKVGLRIAITLLHMLSGEDDPCSFNSEERSILLRARTGDVPPEERVDIYRRTISPENIDRLMKMPDHPTIKNELFQLIDDIISKEEFAC